MSRVHAIVNKLLEAEPFDPRAYLLTPPRYNDRRIRTSFSRYTPESSEMGEPSETGWLDEEGESMEPDEFDQEEGITSVQKAAKWLNDKGAVHASSSHFHPGIWYSTNYETVNYATGEDEERCFHLSGFTPDEEQDIWNEVYAKI